MLYEVILRNIKLENISNLRMYITFEQDSKTQPSWLMVTYLCMHASCMHTVCRLGSGNCIRQLTLASATVLRQSVESHEPCTANYFLVYSILFQKPKFFFVRINPCSYRLSGQLPDGTCHSFVIWTLLAENDTIVSETKSTQW